MLIGLETAALPSQDTQEVGRLLHMVVVGGGPTGVELSGELHDFLEDDLKSWYPELASKIRITLVEALPNVLPMFSKQLINYTESTFKESKIEILTKTMVKEVKEKSVVLQMPDKSIKEVPCGLVVWAAVCVKVVQATSLILISPVSGKSWSSDYPQSYGQISRRSDQ